MPITDTDQIIQALRARVEEVEHERDTLTVAIAEHVEALGGEGCDGDALRDSCGQLERILRGEDLDCTELEGLAGKLRACARVFVVVHEEATRLVKGTLYGVLAP